MVEYELVVERLRAAGCVFAEEEARLLVAAAADEVALARLVERRVEGVPLEHLLGWAEFGGLRVAVEPGVFVPRRRTEFLAESAVALARAGSVVVDLCCGAGAIAAVVAASVPGVRLFAADVDPVAVRCARRTLAGTGAVVCEGDFDAALPEGLLGGVDVLVANVPYVPSEAVEWMPSEARLHEPRTALDGGGDGLDVVRRLIGVAPRWLGSGGRVLFEVGSAQVEAAVAEVEAAGLVPRVRSCAEREATVVVGAR
ncbi:putative protein N(5)-glutamine methyltransferase [Saccharomonospora cyanea]|uniref:peptide chain release factor N(5)-glutamine methyltransferase n=1 Tax=Saccharomonospora cyanea NA-134 TaxID=882082 RepID=H5XF89_9PSEU|nr:putative protein N(5)-glutamine methyltransferase [Saccharomonospora cyanea]EHR61499.1 putative protein-(glutamine-N5) methyltransferase, unknown substrate-specific [Saccharomonospora cyanea NA-134]